jgi:hypothetical protein
MGKIVLPLIINTTAPTTGNTIVAGYPLGQHWFDSTAGVEYIHKSDGIWESNQTATNGTSQIADAKFTATITNSIGTAKLVASVNGESTSLYSELGAYPSSNQTDIFGRKLGGSGGLWLMPLFNSFGFTGTANKTSFIIGANKINRIEIVPDGDIKVAGEIVNDLGKKLSSNDYTTDEKNKLAAIIGVNTGNEIAVGTTAPTGNEDLWIDPTTPEITTADIPAVSGYRYLNESQYNGIWSTGIQVGNNIEVASSSNVGRIRYRTSGNNSYVEMCMQTSANTYDWKIIYQNNW